MRMISLDIFRGLTIFAMSIVNNPGDSSHAYSILQHGAWKHVTPTDLIFPFFLFIVGVALAEALRPCVAAAAVNGHKLHAKSLYVKLAYRAVVLILIGIFINGFPYFHLATWRIPGVLQRIAICYFITAMIFLHTSLRWQLFIGILILGVYSLMLCCVGAPGLTPGQLDPTANLPRLVDLAVFSSAHVAYDWPSEPEGLLSTPAAVVSTLLGCWVSLGLANQPRSYPWGGILIIAGFILMALGWLISPVLPMIKILWTPTYVLFTGGWAIICFGVCYMLIDVKLASWGMWIIQVFGRNAILAYVLSELGSTVMYTANINGVVFPALITSHIVRLSNGFISIEMGSFLYSGLFTFAIWLILYAFYRFGYFIRI